MSEAGRDVTGPPNLALRVSMLYGAWAIVIGTQMAYLPVWLEWRGLSIAEIALVASMPLAFRIVAMPVIAFLADRHNAHRSILIVTAWVCLAAILLLAGMTGFWPILIVHLVATTALSPILPLTETLAAAGARSGALDYGRVRLWASVTFILASLAGGALVSGVGPPAAVGLMAFGAVLTVLAAHGLPRPDRATSGTTGRRPLRWQDAVALLRHPVIVLFLLAAGAVQSAHAVLYVFGTLHWQRLGHSTTMIGLLWSVGVLAEIALFAWSNAVSRYISPVGLILVGAAASVVRWAVMALDPPLGVLVPLQTLHALTYGASHLGAMQFIARAIPEPSSGTAQALYATVSGAVAMALAMQIAGYSYVAYAGLAYTAMVALAAVAGIAAWALKTRWSGGLLKADAATA